MKGGLKIGIELAEHNFYSLGEIFYVKKYKRSAAQPKFLQYLRYLLLYLYIGH